MLREEAGVAAALKQETKTIPHPVPPKCAQIYPSKGRFTSLLAPSGDSLRFTKSHSRFYRGLPTFGEIGSGRICRKQIRRLHAKAKTARHGGPERESFPEAEGHLRRPQAHSDEEVQQGLQGAALVEKCRSRIQNP
eukprot:1328990-Amorphochlora_amoeboformis.AAC.1